MTMCPVAKTDPSGKKYVGKRSRPLFCSPREIAGTEIVAATCK
jgi:hypothetical protein